jgi:ABC-type protease/lipase transport system fused ATPase/permease subunit
VTAVVAAALIARMVLLQARQRVLASTALWFEHVVGQQTLARGLEGCVPPHHLDTERGLIEHARRVFSGPQMLAALDAPFCIVPLLVLFVVQPALAIVTLLTVAILLLSGLRLMRALSPLIRKSSTVRATANGAWQTAAASSVAIEARGMTAGVVNDWQLLHARGISSDYVVARRMAASARTVHICEAASAVLILALGTAMALADSLSIGTIIAVTLLHHSIVRTLGRVLSALPDLAAADFGVTRLTQPLPEQHLRGGVSPRPQVAAVATGVQSSPEFAPQPRRAASAGHP